VHLEAEALFSCSLHHVLAPGQHAPLRADYPYPPSCFRIATLSYLSRRWTLTTTNLPRTLNRKKATTVILTRSLFSRELIFLCLLSLASCPPKFCASRDR
jgi:hypothetical protein